MSRILIVDDSDTIRAVLASAVRGMKLDPVLADCGEKAVELYRAQRPSLVLLDVNMPGIDGYETARRLRAIAPEEWVPIIFLSASEADQDLERAIECGGDDYLVKPVSPVVLSAKMRALQRLDQMRQRLVDMSNELTAANQHLESLSHRDALTGIANRRAFDFLIDRQFREAGRRGEPFSVAMCDVDHFKAFNDRYGHLGGDECLRKVATVLERACKRPTDVAARYGGEEFALLLPETNGEGAALVVERARLELATLAIAHAGSTTAPVVTFSVGIASYSPERDKASRDLAARADEALYRAKQLGRNRCVVL